MSGPKVQAIITDIGGVLTVPPVLAVAEFLTGRGLQLEDVSRCLRAHAHRTGTDALRELELGRLSEDGFMATVAGAIEREMGLRVELGDFSDYYFRTLELNTALLDHLAAKGRAGLRLAVLTNNAREWHPRWLEMPGFEVFEVFVNSALEGVRKPQPEIYRIALQRLALPARACVFLDDLAVNCEAATAVGMRAIQFESNRQAIAELDRLLGRPDEERVRA